MKTLVTAQIPALNEYMNAVLLATHHASATGIVELIVALAVAASLLLFLVVDPKHHHH